MKRFVREFRFSGRTVYHPKVRTHVRALQAWLWRKMRQGWKVCEELTLTVLENPRRIRVHAAVSRKKGYKCATLGRAIGKSTTIAARGLSTQARHDLLVYGNAFEQQDGAENHVLSPLDFGDFLGDGKYDAIREKIYEGMGVPAHLFEGRSTDATLSHLRPEPQEGNPGPGSERAGP